MTGFSSPIYPGHFGKQNEWDTGFPPTLKRVRPRDGDKYIDKTSKKHGYSLPDSVLHGDRGDVEIGWSV